MGGRTDPKHCPTCHSTQRARFLPRPGRDRAAPAGAAGVRGRAEPAQSPARGGCGLQQRGGGGWCGEEEHSGLRRWRWCGGSSRDPCARGAAPAANLRHQPAAPAAAEAHGEQPESAHRGGEHHDRGLQRPHCGQGRELFVAEIAGHPELFEQSPPFQPRWVLRWFACEMPLACCVGKFSGSSVPLAPW